MTMCPAAGTVTSSVPATPRRNARLPGAGSEEVLPRDRGEGRLDLRISDAGGRRDLLPIGPPDDLQFALAIHLGRARNRKFESISLQRGVGCELRSSQARNRPSVLSISYGLAEGTEIWTDQAMSAINDSFKEAQITRTLKCSRLDFADTPKNCQID